MLILVIHIIPIILFLAPSCAKKNDEYKERKKEMRKKKKVFERDLFECPKAKGKGRCNCAERIYGYVSFLREEFVPIQANEEGFSRTRKKHKVCDADEEQANAEYVAKEIYTKKIEKVMQSCLNHCEDPEKLRIYVKSFTDKEFILDEKKYWQNGSRRVELTYAQITYDFDLTPHPDKFWEKVSQMDDNDLGYDEGIHYSIVKVYDEGYKLLRKRAGDPITEEKIREIKAKRREKWEKKWAERQKEENKRMEEIGKKQKEKREKLEAERRKKKEEKEKAEEEAKNKKNPKRAVDKAGKEKNEKSKVDDEKKPETDKKEKKDEKKSAEGDKNDEEEPKKSKESSQKKSEGSKKQSKEKSASQKDEEDAKKDKE